MAAEKTLRDELAMSLKGEFIPTLTDKRAITLLAEAYGLAEPDLNDPVSLIEFSLNFQAHVRYMYADAMLTYHNTPTAKI